MSKSVNVKVEGETRSVTPEASLAGKPLSAVLQHAGYALNTRCGGRGLCVGCQVKHVGGALASLVDGARVDPGLVRSCQVTLGSNGDVETLIEIPDRSLIAEMAQVAEGFDLRIPLSRNPLTDKLAIAIDVGTTTVAALLVQPFDGTILAKASSLNRQVRMGDNVLTRINLCCESDGNVEQLQHAVAHDTIAPLIEKLLQQAEVSSEEVGAICVAGNTTMLHLLVGVDPAPMGLAPFTAAFLEHRVSSACEVFGDLVSPDTQLHLLPSAAAYVGADITGGAVTSGLAYDSKPAFLVDVGTNGEIVLNANGRLLGCATAAGPAFEGHGMSAGRRATDGAIDHLAFTDDGVEVNTIGGKPPRGVCGSAYLDFLSLGAGGGLLDHRGRFTDEMVRRYSGCVMMAECSKALQLAKASGGEPIAITEADVAVIVQAKAAIAAGMLTLLDMVQLKPAEIGCVYFAGGFAAHLNVDHAIGSGLLPGFTPEQVITVGNSSLAAAYASIVDQQIAREIGELAERMEVIELNMIPEFEDHFIDCLGV